MSRNTTDPLKLLWDTAGFEGSYADHGELADLIRQLADGVAERVETFRALLVMTDARLRMAQHALRARGLPVPALPKRCDIVAMHDQGRLCPTCGGQLDEPVGGGKPWQCQQCGAGWPAENRTEVTREDLEAVAEVFAAAGQDVGADLVDYELAEVADKAAGTLRMLHAAVLTGTDAPGVSHVLASTLLTVTAALRVVLGLSRTPVATEVYQDWRHQNGSLVERLRNAEEKTAAADPGGVY